MVLDRYTYVAELVHQVDRENAVETMLMYGLPVALRVLTGATVCRAALHDGTVNLFDQRPYEGRLQVVGISPLAGGNLHGNTSLGLDTQGFVNLHQRLGGYLLREKYLRLSRGYQREHQRVCG